MPSRDKPLLLLGNRDEFRARASAAAAPWSEDARIVGGRDLVAGGSWLALRADGRHAAVTNVRTGLPATAPQFARLAGARFHARRREPRAIISTQCTRTSRATARSISSSAIATAPGPTAPPTRRRVGSTRRARDQQRPHRRALAEDRALAAAFRRKRSRRPADVDDATLLDLLLDERAARRTLRCRIPASASSSSACSRRSSCAAARNTERARARSRICSNDGGAGVHERTLGADVRREGEVEWHFARAGVRWEEKPTRDSR